jgi:NAD(P)-dependent dehydrogenase (short-subunit alcohol dehydrogenase family)
MTKTWFITGTSSGLGRLLVERLLARGDRVVGTLRRPGALDDLLAQYGDRLRVLTLDVTDAHAVRATVARAFEEMGRIDIVVSNAGYGLFGAAEEVTDQQLEQQIATNLIGSIQLIRASLPHLREQGGGRIVQVSSEGGQVVYPGFSRAVWDRLHHRRAGPHGDELWCEPGEPGTNGCLCRYACWRGSPPDQQQCVSAHGRCAQDRRRHDRGCRCRQAKPAPGARKYVLSLD